MMPLSPYCVVPVWHYGYLGLFLFLTLAISWWLLVDNPVLLLSGDQSLASTLSSVAQSLKLDRLLDLEHVSQTPYVGTLHTLKLIPTHSFLGITTLALLSALWCSIQRHNTIYYISNLLKLEPPPDRGPCSFERSVAIPSSGSQEQKSKSPLARAKTFLLDRGPFFNLQSEFLLLPYSETMRTPKLSPLF